MHTPATLTNGFRTVRAVSVIDEYRCARKGYRCCHLPNGCRKPGVVRGTCFAAMQCLFPVSLSGGSSLPFPLYCCRVALILTWQPRKLRLKAGKHLATSRPARR